MSRLVKGILVAEVLGVLGAYALYQAMDNSRDFRRTMNDRFPSALDVYYRSNEWAGVPGTREQDQRFWANTTSSSSSP